MAVLLISRGSNSGGEIIGQCLAHTANFKCVTREDLIASVNRHGELAEKMTAAIPQAARDYQAFSRLRRPYQILMRVALLEYARKGNLAYFGYSGHLLLKKIQHFVRVRLLAPVDLRIRTTMSRLNIGKEEAEGYIRGVDEERTRWARFMYGRDIRDPGLYDICINMDKITFPTVCSMLVHAVQESEFQPTPESAAEVEDLWLATAVEAELVTRQETYTYEVGASARAGTVFLEGPYLEPDEKERVMAIADAVPGVEKVEYKPGYAPTMAFLPSS